MRKKIILLSALILASNLPIYAAFCTKCGSNLPGEANFCPSCGTAVSSAFQTAEPETNTKSSTIITSISNDDSYDSRLA
ncbi:MAG: zinc ribbon domain-containing protein, partial [Candidatus Riflebacteria bacterium]|nr:zinc ribbon domain-containing protein [Candidatus Riflebacteria bacterium]